MKKVFSVFMAVLFMSSSLNANVNTETSIEDDCWSMAVGIYHAAIDSKIKDRTEAIDLAAWVYNDCIENGGY
jgi:hypothetical protein